MNNSHKLNVSSSPRIVSVLLIIILIITSFVGCSNQEDPNSNTNDTTQSDEKKTDDVSTSQLESMNVSTMKVGLNEPFHVELLGSVEADTHVNILPTTSGQIASINAEEGDTVEKGDILFVLGGTNGTEHPSLTQYKLSLANYNASLAAYKNTVDSTNAAVKSAELQLQSAKNQSDGAYVDFGGITDSIESARNSVGLLRTNLHETQIKNERDLDNVLDGRYGLEDAIDDLKDAKKDSILDMEELIDNAATEELEKQYEDQLEEIEDGYDTQIDALQKEIDVLDYQYDTLKSASLLTENQMLAQLQQAQSAEESLYTTQDSTKLKLGLTDGSSDPLRLAEQGFISSKAQSNIAMAQAQAQLDSASINLKSADDQKKNLLIKAPARGKIGNVSVSEGAIVSPQSLLTEIVSENNFVLKVGVDIENANKIDMTKEAEVKIGGKYIKTSIKNISPVVTQGSSLVNVIVELPQISFKPNQTIQVKLPIDGSTSEASKDSLFVPLDSVIIGTERQFVYVVDNGKAKQVTVELGQINGDIIEVISGLDSSDEIIVDGAKDLTVNQPVNVK